MQQQQLLSLLGLGSPSAGVCTVYGLGIEVRENNGGPGHCLLWLLAIFPFSCVQMPPRLLHQCTGYGEIWAGGKNTYCGGWGPADQQEWPSSRNWVLQFLWRWSPLFRCFKLAWERRKPKGASDRAGKGAEAMFTPCFPSPWYHSAAPPLGPTLSGCGPEGADGAKSVSSAVPGDHCEGAVGSWQPAGYVSSLIIKNQKQHLIQR